MLGVQENDMKTCRSKLAKSMLEDLKFSGLQGADLDNPLNSNGVTLVCRVCICVYYIVSLHVHTLHLNKCDFYCVHLIIKRWLYILDLCRKKTFKIQSYFQVEKNHIFSERKHGSLWVFC